MNTFILEPNDAAGVPVLARRKPLLLAPFLGERVLTCALRALAAEGVKRATILSQTGIAEIRETVGQGEAWGMDLDCQASLLPPGGAGQRVIRLDRLPQLPRQPLWDSYRSWQAAQLALLAETAAHRIGMREISPGLFVSLRTRIAASARVTGPGWIGANVCLRANVVIGPNTIIEDGSYIDDGAEVSNSIVGRETYIGAYMELWNSYALENQLLHLDTGACTTVSDRILLSRVRPRPWLLTAGAGMLSWMARPAKRRPLEPAKGALAPGLEKKAAS